MGRRPTGASRAVGRRAENQVGPLDRGPVPGDHGQVAGVVVAPAARCGVTFPAGGSGSGGAEADRVLKGLDTQVPAPVQHSDGPVGRPAPACRPAQGNFG
jgi:hypothetical protein